MRFMLYNIRYGTGKHIKKPLKNIRGYLSNSEKHINEISDFFNKYDPDIIGLVEVDLGSFRMKGNNQAELLSNRLGHRHSYQHKYLEDSKYMKIPILRNQGNAFLSKDKIENEKFHYFSSGMKKLVIELELDNVVIFLVHLALGAKTRLKQINQLFKMIDETKKPVIVAGDFNLLWGPHEIDLFLRASRLNNVNINNESTYPSWNPKKTLDFILYSDKVKINDFQIIKTDLSDHLPILIDFDIINT